MNLLDDSTRGSVVFAAVLIVGFAVLRSSLLAGVIPPLQGPDETKHFDYAQRLAEHQSLPDACAALQFSEETRAINSGLVVEVAFNAARPAPTLARLTMPDPSLAEARATSGAGDAATYPPFYYSTVALGYWTRSSGTYLERLFAARMVSVLWGGATALALFLVGLFFFRRLWDAVLLGLLAVTQPMLGFLSAVVNNDAALFACTSGAFAAIAAARTTAHRQTSLIVFAGISTIGVLSKSTYLLCLPILFVFCAFALGPRKLLSWSHAAAALALPALLALGWTLGSPSGTGGILGADMTTLSLSHFLRSQVFEFSRLEWLWVRTYWMAWGWLDTHLPRGFIWVFVGILGMAAAGLGLGWRTARLEERAVIVLGLASSAGMMCVLYVLEFFIIRRTGDAFIQGRYLLPLFAIHAVLLVIGLRWFGRAVRVPLAGPWILVAYLTLVNGAAFFRLLSRYYA